MQLQGIIVDDEAPARNELRYLLADLEGISVIGEAETGEEALKLIREQTPEVIFLDIKMPGIDGLEMSRKFLTDDENVPQIVFVTAYDEYAVEAFELNAVDYLLKPFSKDRLQKTVRRLTEHFNQDELLQAKISRALSHLSNSVDKIPVKGPKGRIKLIRSSNIYFAFTEGGDVMVKTKAGEFKTDFTLKNLEKTIDNPHFFRCHRSFLVNLEAVEELIPWFKGGYKVVIEDFEQKIPVGRTRVEELKERLNI